MWNEYNIVELRKCWQEEKLYKSLWKVRNRKEIKIKILTIHGAKKSEQEKTKKGCEFPKKSLLLIKLLKSSPRVNLYSVKDTFDETHTTHCND